ncbi:disulfide bond formation protein B [Pontixanthobacter aquaemixtae]|uniref:Disulfide bond formation protein B n=1 Tax=Pontixanthobacter aquaemixtae TaxID=1958940 RepID=A0A844ZW20_9SPHN|nr:disulfide bond formation protein B [Pontixanthobacter aquaemixtae]MXO91370.1 disulfide bond formation protein B [Pontixanthobacter aquaemixtae]
MNQSLRSARTLALVIPALLLGGAYVSQYGFGLYPCEMCWWQRWPHFAALALAILSCFIPPARFWIMLSGLAIIVSGLIGGFHAGVEYGWWEGLTSCATAIGAGGGDPLDAIMNAPLIRCDVAPWTLFGVSLAGWNFLISTVSGCAIVAMSAKARA